MINPDSDPSQEQHHTECTKQPRSDRLIDFPLEFPGTETFLEDDFERSQLPLFHPDVDSSDATQCPVMGLKPQSENTITTEFRYGHSNFSVPLDLMPFGQTLDYGDASDPYHYDHESEAKSMSDAIKYASTYRSWINVENDQVHQQYIKNYLEKRRALLSFITPEQKEQMRNDVEVATQMYTNMADNIGLPAILWRGKAIIMHVNLAFIEMTGFSEQIPNSPDHFLLLDMLYFGDPTKAETKIYQQSFLYKGPLMLIPVYLRVWDDTNKMANFVLLNPATGQEELYIEGVINLKWEKDVLGFSTLGFWTFSPSPAALRNHLKRVYTSIKF